MAVGRLATVSVALRAPRLRAEEDPGRRRGGSQRARDMTDKGVPAAALDDRLARAPGAEHLATSDAFLNLDQMPPRIVFVGGGYISFRVRASSRRSAPAPT